MIEQIEVVPVAVPTVRPHRLAMTTISTHTMVLVRMTGSDGHVGVGEVGIIEGYGPERLDTVRDVVRVASPLLMHPDRAEDPITRALEQIVGVSRSAAAAVEMAWYDLVARRDGVPAQDLLGGARRDTIPLTWILGIGEAGPEIDESREMYARHGITNLLVKLGRALPEQDLARVAALRAELGDLFHLRVDVNQAWSREVAVDAVGRLADLGVVAVEQPLPAGDLAGMGLLAERFPGLVMADEAVVDRSDAVAVAGARAASAVSVKPSKHGGLRAAGAVAEVAASAGMALFGGTMLESSVGTAALARFYATLPGLDHGCQLCGPLLLDGDLTASPVQITGGALVVPTGVGLSAPVDEDRLSHFRTDR